VGGGKQFALPGLRGGRIDFEDAEAEPRKRVAVGEGIESGAEQNVLTDSAGDGGGELLFSITAANGEEGAQGTGGNVLLRTRRAADLGVAYAQGRQILRSQRYNVRRIVETGDEVAVELEWTGTLAVSVMNLPAGSEMKAFVAMFLTFRDGKIISQRNYDCYPPFAP
jgi:hypothetical protein